MEATQTTPPIRVIGLTGSLREESYTRLAVQIALDGAAAAGAEVELLDLRDYTLPFCSGIPKDEEYPPDVFMLREQVKSSAGVILGSPEYHGGMSGVLKNALDLMGFKEFEGKLVGLVGVSGGMMGATNALVSLRNVGRALHAWVMPDQVSIPQAWAKFERDGSLNDQAIQDRLVKLGQEVAHYASLHTADNDRDFLHEWQVAPNNPGGRQIGQRG